ncbi:MAG TPA: GAF domain-containing protein, partial [Anaerolineae bacterium]|nr:GAF domain-containing protein [Anaerolineae bacterium]
AEQRRRQEAETLREAALSLTTSLDRNQVVERILSQLQQVVPYDGSSVQLLKGDRLEIVGGRGFPNLSELLGLSFSVDGDNPNREVVRTRAPFILEDAPAAYEGFRQEPYAQLGIRSWLGVPMLVGERFVGMITLDKREPGFYTEEHARLAQAFAVQAAVAIENARLYEETRRRAVHQAALNAIIAAATASSDLPSLLETALDRTLQALGLEMGAIWLKRELGDPHHVVLRGLPPEIGSASAKTAAESGLDIPGPVVASDWEAEVGPVATMLPHFGVRASVTVPLLAEGQRVGGLTVAAPQPRPWSDEEIRLVEAVGRQLGEAVERERLYTALQRHAETLEETVAARTAELRAQKEQLETILRSTGDAIVITDTQLRIAMVNPAFEALTGYRTEEVLGQNPLEGLVSSSQSEILDRIAEAFQAGEVWRGEAVIRRKDGSTYDADITVAPMRDPEGQIIGYVSSHRDITYLKEVDRMKDQFVSNVSHELRTPLANLRLYLDLLEKGRPEKRDRYMETLYREADRLQELIEDLLSLSQLDLGKVQANLQPTDLNQLVRVLVDDRAMLAADRGLGLTADLAKELPQVMADPKMMGQVLTNLVTNAMNYTPAGGSIVIRTQMRQADGQRWATVSVSDTGVGIAPEEQERLFERFFRGEAARRTGAAGTGLGLAICKEIVDRHQGRITVESDLGQGSTFTVWLPVS